MFRTLLISIILVFTSMPVLPQLPATADTTDTEKQEKEALDLLRETMAEVDGLRLPENRISFTAELASLMWMHDEREARSMYSRVIGDFRQLIAQLDAQMSLYDAKPIDGSNSLVSLFVEPTERQRAVTKFKAAYGVRQGIALSMADHDPELALNFFYDTATSISSPDIRRDMTMGDRALEEQLMGKMAVADPAKAEQLGKKSLENGFNSTQVDLLKKIFAKDADRGADFGDAVLSRLKTERAETLDLNAASSLLQYGTQNFDQSKTSATKPVYTDSQLRDIADTFALAVIARPNDSGLPFANFAREVERFQPGRAAQIRSKVQGRPQQFRAGGQPPGRLMASANSNTSYGSGLGSGYASNTNSAAANLARTQQEQDKKLLDDTMKVGSDKITPEQRENIVQQVRKTLMSAPTRDKKVMGLSLLAAQVAKSGDRDLALEIMRDASTFVDPQPKNYQDFMLTWMLASGYASVDTDRSFSMLDDAIGRTNDVIAAAIKVGEFIDVNEDVISDGEFQVGAFGNSLVREITTELSIADPTIQTLVKANLEKTRALANRFDRPEARVLAKMLVLRAVFKQLDKSSTKVAGIDPGVKL